MSEIVERDLISQAEHDIYCWEGSVENMEADGYVCEPDRIAMGTMRELISEIQRLQAELEGANKRADEAENEAKHSAYQYKQLLERLETLIEEDRNLKAQLAAKDKELEELHAKWKRQYGEQVNENEMVHEELATRDEQIAELKEQRQALAEQIKNARFVLTDYGVHNPMIERVLREARLKLYPLPPTDGGIDHE